MSARVCGCFHNQETGHFEPCCQEHEWEYVAYLESLRDAKMIPQILDSSEDLIERF